MPGPVCISCGYALAGLARESLCPECAFPVARSLDASTLLRTAEPGWLKRLWIGFRLLNFALRAWLAALIAFIPGLLVILASELSFIARAIANHLMAAVGVLLAAGLGAGLLCIAPGLWLITAPTHGPQSPPARHRLALRWLGIPLALLPLILIPISPMWRLTSLPQPGIYAARAGVQVAGLAAVYALTLILEHYERCAPHTPTGRAHRSGSPRHNLAVAAVLFIIGWVLTFSQSRVVVTMPLGFAPLILAIAFMSFDNTFSRLRRSIEAERAIAGREAASQHASPM